MQLELYGRADPARGAQEGEKYAEIDIMAMVPPSACVWHLSEYSVRVRTFRHDYIAVLTLSLSAELRKSSL